MDIKGKLPSWLSKLILKQERRLRKEYEEYVCECEGAGIIPLRYAAWRRRKLEPQIIEVLLEECQLNEN